MQYEKVFIPYGAYWTTPFSKWQGSFATQQPIPFAARVAQSALDSRNVPVDAIDGICLGTTIPSRHSFYGAAWLAGSMGRDDLTGATISQACATSVRCLVHAAESVTTGCSRAFLTVTADRTSNGPHVYYPDPAGVGGTGVAENWVLDNFSHDPHARNSMLQTAENVARVAEIGREQQERITLLRYEQYRRACEEDGKFHSRYMVTPLEVRDSRGKKVLATVTGDEGVFPTTAEGLARLRPAVEGGTVTFGTQTFPADGNAGLLVTDAAMARELSRDAAVSVQLLSHGQARVDKGMMPMANVPAVRMALARAGIDVSDLTAVTTHAPFAVNDAYLARELSLAPESMNRYGCSLIWGHPQAPTGMRSIIELIEELAECGGGYGLFTGCAAGDSAAAVVVKVTVN